MYYYDIQLAEDVPDGSKILGQLGRGHVSNPNWLFTGEVFAWRAPAVLAIKSVFSNIDTRWSASTHVATFTLTIDGVERAFQILGLLRTDEQGLAPRNRPTTVPRATKLDQVIENIPWAHHFHFGAGMSAVSGALCGTALRPFDVVPAKSGSSSERYLFIENAATMSQEIEASASGKYNIEGVTVSASTQYLERLDFSEISTTLIASYTWEGYENEVSRAYELTEDAKKLIDKHHEFSQAYGDYFIAGGLRGHRFLATYVCTARTKKCMDAFKASVKADVSGIFSSAGSARFMKAASENDVTLEVQVYTLGEDPKNRYPKPARWTPDMIPLALEWLKSHQVGAVLSAELRHYSTVVNTYPRTIDIDPDTFVELRLLYLDLWEARSRYSGLPAYYRDQFRKRFDEINVGITSNQEQLVSDPALLKRYQYELSKLLEDFQGVYSRMDFYFRVVKAVGTEPAKGTMIYEDGGQHSWLYGYATDPLGQAVSIQTQSIPFKAVSDHLHFQENTIEVTVPNALIVGWKATSNWHDGTGGGFCKTTDQILLTDKASVHFKSKWARGCDWQLDVYYVSAKEYVFDRDESARALPEARGTGSPGSR